MHTSQGSGHSQTKEGSPYRLNGSLVSEGVGGHCLCPSPALIQCLTECLVTYFTGCMWGKKGMWVVQEILSKVCAIAWVLDISEKPKHYSVV